MEEGEVLPKTLKITKEMILDTAFDIAKEEGMNQVSNREIAKRLNSSIRPIYYQFSNTEELKKELYQKIERYFYQVIMADLNDSMPQYKQIGINYIKFACTEKNLFQILFMSKGDYFLDSFVSKDAEDFSAISKLIKLSTNLNEKDIESFHLKMWIFTHGIATLAAKGTITFTPKQIEELLSLEFQALMLLEENPDNKWVLKKKEEIKK